MNHLGHPSPNRFASQRTSVFSVGGPITLKGVEHLFDDLIRIFLFLFSRWLKDGLKLRSTVTEYPTNLNREGLHLFILTISHGRFSDSGNYTCVLTKRREQEQLISISYIVKVIPKEKKRWCQDVSYPSWLEPSDSPWLIEPASELAIKISDSAILDCVPKYAQARKDLIWQLPTGTLMNHTDSLSNFKVFPNGSLKIEDMKRNVQGFYKCIAGEALNASTDVYLPMPAKMSKLPSGFETYAGCTFRLRCAAAGDEPLDLTIRIPRGSRATGRISSSATQFFRELIYELTNVQMSDGGIYECGAKNAFGPKSTTRVELVITRTWNAESECPPEDVVIQDLAKYERPYQQSTGSDQKEGYNGGRRCHMYPIGFLIVPVLFFNEM